MFWGILLKWFRCHVYLLLHHETSSHSWKNNILNTFWMLNVFFFFVFNFAVASFVQISYHSWRMTLWSPFKLRLIDHILCFHSYTYVSGCVTMVTHYYHLLFFTLLIYSFQATDGGEVEAIRPLPWYPENLAWQSNYSRMQLRKNQTLERYMMKGVIGPI